MRISRFILFISIFTMLPLVISAQERDDSVKNDSVKNRSFLKGLAHATLNVIKAFNDYDTAYIEPQHYNYALMIQNTSTYERYELDSKSGQLIVLSPNLTNKVGPYFGWRWIFLGYTFDIKNISINTNNSVKKEFELSLYSSLFGIDFVYRRTGSDYKIRSINLGENINTNSLIGMPFKGINVGITGINVYYIFNHHQFSYPAAFSQSTCQKKSAGSFIGGISYTKHTISLDHQNLQSMIDDKLPSTVKLDSGLMFNKVEYVDVSVSLGYAYNYVFARNWLLSASLSPALAYKYSAGNLDEKYSGKEFSFRNFNFDLISRVGIVWNNIKWYGGMSAIVHSYNYNKSQFSTSNLFGSINLYFGVNFDLRKNYQKTSKQRKTSIRKLYN